MNNIDIYRAICENLSGDNSHIMKGSFSVVERISIKPKCAIAACRSCGVSYENLIQSMTLAGGQGEGQEPEAASSENKIRTVDIKNQPGSIVFGGCHEHTSSFNTRNITNTAIQPFKAWLGNGRSNEMRLSADRLIDITRLQRTSSQVKWFRQHLGVDVPYDRFGPILTDEAYEKLLEKRLGLGATLSPDKARPTLRP